MPEQPYGRSSSRSTGNGRSRRRRGYHPRRSGRDIRTADMATVNGGPRHVSWLSSRCSVGGRTPPSSSPIGSACRSFDSTDDRHHPSKPVHEPARHPVRRARTHSRQRLDRRRRTSPPAVGARARRALHGRDRDVRDDRRLRRRQEATTAGRRNLQRHRLPAPPPQRSVEVVAVAVQHGRNLQP
jgi:hypothetical protein